jgi:hypothetical protein
MRLTSFAWGRATFTRHIRYLTPYWYHAASSFSPLRFARRHAWARSYAPIRYVTRQPSWLMPYSHCARGPATLKRLLRSVSPSLLYRYHHQHTAPPPQHAKSTSDFTTCHAAIASFQQDFFHYFDFRLRRCQFDGHLIFRF